MTDRRITQVVPLVGGSVGSEVRITQVGPLVGGSLPSDVRVSQVVLLVAGRIEAFTGGYWGVRISP